MIVIVIRLISLSLLYIILQMLDGYVGKQPVVWKEYCVEYW